MYYIIIFRILCQGSEDNPIHADAFNELIENLKEKNAIWSRTTFNCERSVSRTLFMEESIVTVSYTHLTLPTKA